MFHYFLWTSFYHREISSWSVSSAYIHVLFLLLVWRLKGMGSNKIGLFGWRLFLDSFRHSRDIYWTPTIARHYARYWGYEGKIAMVPALTELTISCSLSEIRCQFGFILGRIKKTALLSLIDPGWWSSRGGFLHQASQQSQPWKPES